MKNYLIIKYVSIVKSEHQNEIKRFLHSKVYHQYKKKLNSNYKSEIVNSIDFFLVVLLFVPRVSLSALEVIVSLVYEKSQRNL